MDESEFVWVLPPVREEGSGYREWDGSYVTGMEEEAQDIPAPGRVPPIGLTVSLAGAATLLNIDAAEFEQFVCPYLRLVVVADRELVPVRELERRLEWSGAELL